MKYLVTILYLLLSPFVLLISLPFWVLKMIRRNGWSVELLERIGWYQREIEFEPYQPVYVQAVSVGEIFIAKKLLEKWIKQDPREQFILSVTTSTGHAIAKKLEVFPQIRVIYTPLDIPFLMHRMWKRFEPKHIVLIESEIWPYFVLYARSKGIPVSLANARLSPRSERRYGALSFLVQPIFSTIGWIGVANSIDAKRWRAIGIDEKSIEITGSIKFDYDLQVVKKKSAFQQSLNQFGDRLVVLYVSTHSGEERWIAEALKDLEINGKRLLHVVVPRHAERRDEVCRDLRKEGVNPVLWTQWNKESLSGENQFNGLIIDTTGDLKDWSSLADVAIIGKSFLHKGGQNPTETLVAQVPTICGEFMANFEPLISELRDCKAVQTAINHKELRSEVIRALSGGRGKVKNAVAVLNSHTGATEKTIEALQRKVCNEK